MPLRHLRRLAAAALVAPVSLAAQQAVPAAPPAASVRGGFIILSGMDTVATERFARFARAGGDSVEVDLRLTRGPRLHEAFVDSLALVPRMALEQFGADAAPGAPPLGRLTLRFSDTTLVAEGNGTPQTVVVRAGTLPWVNPTFSLVEQLVRRARQLGGAHVEIPMVNVQGAAQFMATIDTSGTDSVVVRFPDAEMHVATDATGRVNGARIPAQNIVVVRTGELPEPVATAPAEPLDYAAPAGAPYTATNVTVKASDGATLAGTFTRPASLPNGKKLPAMILLTGSGPEDRDEASPYVPGYRPFRQLADTLGRRGIAVLRLDDRGVGGSAAAPGDVSLETLAADTRAAIAWLRARPDVDGTRIVVLGHSEGAEVAPMVAADDRSLRALVLLGAPASTGRATSDRQVRAAIARMMSDSSAAARERMFAQNGQLLDSIASHSVYVRSFFTHDPVATARRVRQPVLILQGGTDTQVAPSEATALAAAIRAGGNKDVTVRVFPETNHLFLADSVGEAGTNASAYAALPSKAVRPTVLGAVVEWVVGKVK